MQTSDDITLRIFTHPSAPDAEQVVRQATRSAIEYGLASTVIDGSADPMQVIEAGIIAVPAVVIDRGGVESSRRECVRPGRSLERWIDRRLARLGVDAQRPLSIA